MTDLKRKTGLAIAAGQRDSEGFEDIDMFYEMPSSSPSKGKKDEAVHKTNNMTERRKTELRFEHKAEDNNDYMIPNRNERKIESSYQIRSPETSQIEQTISESVSMDLDNSILKPSNRANQSISNAVRFLSYTPRKTHLLSPAVRIPSPRKTLGSAVRTPLSQRTSRLVNEANFNGGSGNAQDSDKIARKLDFQMLANDLGTDNPQSFEQPSPLSGAIDIHVDELTPPATHSPLEANASNAKHNQQEKAISSKKRPVPSPKRISHAKGLSQRLPKKFKLTNYDSEGPESDSDDGSVTLNGDTTPNRHRSERQNRKQEGERKHKSTNDENHNIVIYSEKPEVYRHDNSHPDDGATRRSSRIKVPPLAFWRNERIVYELGERPNSGPAVPRIREIIHVSDPLPRKRAQANRKNAHTGHVHGTKQKISNVSEDEPDDDGVETNDEAKEPIIGEVIDWPEDVEGLVETGKIDNSKFRLVC